MPGRIGVKINPAAEESDEPEELSAYPNLIYPGQAYPGQEDED